MIERDAPAQYLSSLDRALQPRRRGAKPPGGVPCFVFETTVSLCELRRLLEDS
jgi:hypothetical protein